MYTGMHASFPHGDPFPYIFNPASPRFLTDASIETISENYQWPLVYQLNAAVQRQLPHNVSATAAYVGTLSRHMPFFEDDNYAPYAPGASTSQASIDARRPYNNNHTLGEVTYLESRETASYHSLQFTASRPLTHNLMLNGFYVWSHNIESVNPDADGQGTAQDFDNLWEERGPTDNDRRHVASISGTWNIDYYKGSSFVAKQVVNGWTISPIVSLESGRLSPSQRARTKTSTVKTPIAPTWFRESARLLDPHRSRSVSRNAWFNTAAFTPTDQEYRAVLGPAVPTATHRATICAHRDIATSIWLFCAIFIWNAAWPSKFAVRPPTSSTW